MKYWTGALLVALATPSLLFADEKFVGVWEGNFDTPIYTKLVIHDAQTLTYCDVMSCRQIDCFKMNISGSLDGSFTYEDSSGIWKFLRLNEEEIEASFTNVEGDVSTSIYEPE